MHHAGPYISRIVSLFRRKTAGFVTMGILCFFSWSAQAQAPFPPPNQLQVYNVQGIDFGSFYPSSTSGTVTISPTGMRSSPNITLVGGMASQAIFDVVLVPGRLVSISWGFPTEEVTLTGSNGGSMRMKIGPTDKTSTGTNSAQFVTTGGHPFHNQVYFGGTLTVGSVSANPPGNYTGEFFITFHQN